MNEERNVDSNNSNSSSNNNNSDATIRRTAARVVDYLHKSAEGGGGASARDIAEQNGLYPQKVYDVLAVIGAFPNELTPLAEKRGRVYVTPSRWADGIDSAIVAELQHAKILVEKIKIVLRCTEAGAEEVGRKDMVLKQLEYVKVELPQNYVF